MMGVMRYIRFNLRKSVDKKERELGMSGILASAGVPRFFLRSLRMALIRKFLTKSTEITE